MKSFQFDYSLQDYDKFYILSNNKGLAFGYYETKWTEEAHTFAIPWMYEKKYILWAYIQYLTTEEQQLLIVETLLKVIRNQKDNLENASSVTQKFQANFI